MTDETKKKISKTRKGRKISEKHKQKMRKPILQYSLVGEFIKKWQSATHAEKELNIKSTNICMCCKGKIKTAKGFIWRYKD